MLARKSEHSAWDGSTRIPNCMFTSCRRWLLQVSVRNTTKKPGFDSEQQAGCCCRSMLGILWRSPILPMTKTKHCWQTTRSPFQTIWKPGAVLWHAMLHRTRDIRLCWYLIVDSLWICTFPAAIRCCIYWSLARHSLILINHPTSLINNLHRARLNLKAYKESLIWTIILSHQFSIPLFRICSSSAYKPREAVQHSNYKIRETKIKCSGSTRKQIRITPQSHKALVLTTGGQWEHVICQTWQWSETQRK